MATDKIVPSRREVGALDLNDPKTAQLIRQAEESHAADQLLTVRQALVRYKKAVFWAVFLSTSLVMEGYDLVLVRTATHGTRMTPTLTSPASRSRLSMARHSSNNGLETTIPWQERSK